MKGKCNSRCKRRCVILAVLMCVLSSCAFRDKSADDVSGYSGISPSDNSQEETEETSNAENATFNRGKLTTHFPAMEHGRLRIISVQQFQHYRQTKWNHLEE